VPQADGAACASARSSFGRRGSPSNTIGPGTGPDVPARGARHPVQRSRRRRGRPACRCRGGRPRASTTAAAAPPAARPRSASRAAAPAPLRFLARLRTISTCSPATSVSPSASAVAAKSSQSRSASATTSGSAAFARGSRPVQPFCLRARQPLGSVRIIAHEVPERPEAGRAPVRALRRRRCQSQSSPWRAGRAAPSRRRERSLRSLIAALTVNVVVTLP
jgi:hypothetical protein